MSCIGKSNLLLRLILEGKVKFSEPYIQTESINKNLISDFLKRINNEEKKSV